MEIELKLRLAPAALKTLLADPLLDNASKARKQLDNIYYDTPDRVLAKAGISLRLRRDGKRWLQTVKRGGTSRAGLHQREEIEFEVAGPAFEWKQLQGTPLWPVLKPLQQQLVVQFRTRFDRQIRRLQGAMGAEIELAIDQGEIRAGDRSEALCELELELLSGPVDDIFSLALLLVERHPLVADNRSKAERGGRLALGAPPAGPAKAGSPSLPADASPYEVTRTAIEQCLAHWQANEAGFLNTPDNIEYLHQVRVAVRRLRVACGPLASALQWQVDHLTPLLGDLRKLGQGLGVARDWDVFIDETWPPLAEQLGDAALRQSLQEAATLLQGTAHLQAQAALQSRETQRLLLQLGRCLAQADDPSDTASASFDALTDQLDRLEKKLRQGLPKLESLSAVRLHSLRIVAKKLRYLTEFVAHRYDAKAVDTWLDWLKDAQSIFGGRNDRATAKLRIDTLCDTLEVRSGKARKTLEAALREQALPELNLPALPDPYWR